MNYCFVYGTLKRGGRFDSPEFQEARKLEIPVALPGARLYDLGSFPTIRLTDDHNEIVYGEIHGYEDDTWDWVSRRMDMIEGFRQDSPDTSLFNKVQIPIQFTSDDADQVEEAQCTVYHLTDQNWERMNSEDRALVESGEWQI